MLVHTDDEVDETLLDLVDTQSQTSEVAVHGLKDVDCEDHQHEWVGLSNEDVGIVDHVLL